MCSFYPAAHLLGALFVRYPPILDMHTFTRQAFSSVPSFAGIVGFLFESLESPPALPLAATLVTLSFVIHGWMAGVCVFSSTCCVGHITAAALNSGLITSHFTHLTSSPAPHNLLFPASPLDFASVPKPVQFYIQAFPPL